MSVFGGGVHAPRAPQHLGRLAVLVASDLAPVVHDDGLLHGAGVDVGDGAE